MRPRPSNARLGRGARGHINAIDLLPSFLEHLEERKKDRTLADRITTKLGAMGDISATDQADGSIDLIGSEGAIYNIGFDVGLAHWRRLLAPNGRIGVSERVWLGEDRPEAIQSFWRAHYPAMRSRTENEQAIREAGYRSLGQVLVPKHDWSRDDYDLIAQRLIPLREERHDAEWQEQIALIDEELEVVRDGLEFFGYVFFVMALDG